MSVYWVMVLFLSGTGQAAVVMPFNYPTAEACKLAYEAGRDAKRYGAMPDYFCVPSPAALVEP